MGWLDRIIDLCNKKGANLILFKTLNNGKIIQPVLREEAFEYIDEMAYYNVLGEISRQKNVPFLNMNLLMTGTNHNDVESAKKATSCFGKWLVMNKHIELENEEYR